ncbi:MAG: shikimate dehydrogenase [Pirellulaceae bacterium]
MPHIDAKTKVCAVIGHPVGHSLSPELHNAAFEARQLPFVYVAHDIQPGQVGQALEGMRAMGYRGVSVTIPHKVESLHCMDKVDETALGIGCINTVVNDGGFLRGYNSDGLGALGALREAGADPQDRRVLLLGSGGVARAIAVTLAVEAPPSKISILGVEMEQLAQLVTDVDKRGKSSVAGGEFSDEALKAALAETDIVLQCSPIGMHPKEDNTIVPASLLRSELIVFDVVYNPRKTKLLKEAEAAGCRVIQGMEMFLGQAYVQFQLWTGEEPPRDVMRRVVEERL